tara:strand:- start:1906 stop:3153 length:1248 start_codon:yes stop_codon:yes gene_type:complete
LCKGTRFKRNETTGFDECRDCGWVDLNSNREETGTFDEGGTREAAFSQKFKEIREHLEGDIPAYIPHRGKRKFASKEKEKNFNERKHKKIERKVRTLREASKDYDTTSRARQSKMEEIMIESGWERIPGWKWDADASGILRNTTLDQLGEGHDSLTESMRRAIEGASIPERGLFLFSEGDEDDTRIVTPKKEGSALEFYIMRTHEDDAYWFLDDFCRRVPVNKQRVSNLLSSRLPLSTQSFIRCDEIYQEKGKITSEMIREFTIKAGNALDFETNGLENDSRPPLPFGDGVLTEDYKRKISLCPKGESEPTHIHRWVEFEVLEDQRISTGVLRSSTHPLILTHIPLAYSLAQRVFDGLRNNDQWRNICMKILNLIEDEMEWCNSTVMEMDSWWESEVKGNSLMENKPVTVLRGHQ